MIGTYDKDEFPLWQLAFVTAIVDRRMDTALCLMRKLAEISAETLDDIARKGDVGVFRAAMAKFGAPIPASTVVAAAVSRDPETLTVAVECFEGDLAQAGVRALYPAIFTGNLVTIELLLRLVPQCAGAVHPRCSLTPMQLLFGPNNMLTDAATSAAVHLLCGAWARAGNCPAELFDVGSSKDESPLRMAARKMHTQSVLAMVHFGAKRV
jgi:hypothetical protein